MACEWVDCDRDFVGRRYDRIASWIVLFEWLLLVPAALRRAAANRLDLRPGDRVVELGCGTGRNLPFLRAAVGPRGKVYGIDLSAGMLARAAQLRDRHGWDNVELIQVDAAEFVAPEPLDGVLFGLSYNTMPHHRLVLQNAWMQLRPGGRIVIMDAKAPEGIGRTLALRFGIWLMKHTLLGNPLIQPWKHLAAMADEFSMQEYLLGSYYICHGAKPGVRLAPALPAPATLTSTERPT
jgi:demethylmenaquinone methyltransferase/2-methoxy-6-polyprenyl-1,4-benzoquinol methylase